MYDLVLVLILHLSLLQLLGRRLPAGSETERVNETRRAGASPNEETARRMIERAYPASCSDLREEGRSTQQEG